MVQIPVDCERKKKGRLYIKYWYRYEGASSLRIYETEEAESNLGIDLWTGVAIPGCMLVPPMESWDPAREIISVPT